MLSSTTNAADRNPYDVDGDGTADPLSDGILILRYLSGLTGNALMNGVVNPAGTRTDEASLMAHLRMIESSFLDPDGDASNLPQSDGVVVLRHLADFDGEPLVSGALNLEQGIRRSSATVQKYVNQPINSAPSGTVESFTTNEDVRLDVSAVNGLLKHVSDPDGDAITARLGIPAGNGTVEVRSDGSFSYVPETDFFGSDSFTFIATDVVGAEIEITTQITVVAVNDSPSTPEQSFEVANDGFLSVSAEQGLLRGVLPET